MDRQIGAVFEHFAAILAGVISTPAGHFFAGFRVKKGSKAAFGSYGL